jgi:hypothetical protein
MRNQGIILLLQGRNHSTIDWSDIAMNSSVIECPNVSILGSALERGVEERDIQGVIIDAAMEASGFLDFLTTIPTSYRGDILFICSSGTYLSSSLSREGRVFYSMRESDLSFYLFARFGAIQTPAPVPRLYAVAK